MVEDLLNISFEKLRKFPRQFILPLLLLTAGVIFFIYGLIQYLIPNTSPVVPHMQTSSIPATENATEIAEIVVDVEGGVVSPGIYRLPVGKRVGDVLVMAGGISSEADRVLIGKQLNMATKLSDGMKIYVPIMNEGGAINGSNLSDGLANVSSTGNSAVSEVIQVNSASAQSLDSLPGIGPVTAQKIISGRPYSDVEELVTRKIVSQKVFDGIKDKIGL